MSDPGAHGPHAQAGRIDLMRVFRAAMLTGFGALIVKLFALGQMAKYLASDLDWLTGVSGGLLLAMGAAEAWLAVTDRRPRQAKLAALAAPLPAGELARPDDAVADIGAASAEVAPHGHAHHLLGGPRGTAFASVLIVATLAFGLTTTPETLSASTISGGRDLAPFLMFIRPREVPATQPPTPLEDFGTLARYLSEARQTGAGQPVRLVGRVEPSGGLRPGEFAMLRISIVHCIADGQPVGLIVRGDGPAPASGTWAEVSGTVAIDPRPVPGTCFGPDGLPVQCEAALVVVDAATVTPVPEPETPYIGPIL